MLDFLCLLSVIFAPSAARAPEVEPFTAPKFGVKADIPSAWKVLVREKDDRVFVALIPQADPEHPGVAACELGLAPESLEEYRTRIEGNAKRAGSPGKLVRNEIVKTPKGDRLESLREFRPAPDVLWRELSVRMIANRQMYTFVLNVDDATYPAAKTAFDALISSAVLSPPNTGADLADRAKNRWAQREFKFALDLPDGWRPALAPDEVALFYANGPAHGIWSDNALVVARKHGDLDLARLAETLPDALRREEPNCEVLSCKVVAQGKLSALETVVRTRRGPFSMTVLERRFAADRFDYEVKFTVESKRFEELAPAMRKALDSFAELPGDVPDGPGRPG